MKTNDLSGLGHPDLWAKYGEACAAGTDPDLIAALEAELLRREQQSAVQEARDTAAAEFREAERAKAEKLAAEKARLENLRSAKEKISRAEKFMASHQKHFYQMCDDFHAAQDLAIEALDHMRGAGMEVRSNDNLKWTLELACSNDVHRLSLPVRPVGFDAGRQTALEVIQHTRAQVTSHIERDESRRANPPPPADEADDGDDLPEAAE